MWQWTKISPLYKDFLNETGSMELFLAPMIFQTNHIPDYTVAFIIFFSRLFFKVNLC